jgi:hypothetical protein
MPRRAGFIVVGLAAAGLLLAGCTQIVSGHGAAANGSGSPPNSDFPSSSPGPTPTTTAPTAPSTPTPTSAPPSSASHLACPHVVDGTARLAYDCITTGMTQGRNAMWPVDFELLVDTGWTLDEGSGGISRGGVNPAVAAKVLTQEMLQVDYGTPAPASKTVHDADLNVGSATGHVVQTLITLNPTFRARQHLRVKQEQLWLVVVPAGGGQFSAWYVSVPDLQKQLWPTVPALLKTLRVV